MANFTIRVELHGAIEAHYTLLHVRLGEIGFRRFVEGVRPDGTTGTWSLPTAEYDFSSEETAFQLRDRVKLIADSVKPGAWVLVTQVANRAWTTQLLKVT